MTDKTEVLVAGACDLAVLAEVNARSFAAVEGEPVPGTAWSLRSFAEIMALPGVFAFLTQQDGEPAGLALAQAVHEEAELFTLGVVPSARQTGLGRLLLQAVLAESTRRGALRLVLEVAEHNFRARSLYEQAGFRIIGQRRNYYREDDGQGIDAVVLALSLENPSL